MQKWTISNKESEHFGQTIELLNLGELELLKRNEPEEVLISISGNEILAKDADNDTRMGYVAYGFLEGYLFA